MRVRLDYSSTDVNVVVEDDGIGAAVAKPGVGLIGLPLSYFLARFAAGICFAVLFRTTGSLWAAFGAHWAWNFATAILGFANPR